MKKNAFRLLLAILKSLLHIALCFYFYNYLPFTTSFPLKFSLCCLLFSILLDGAALDAVL